MTKHEHDHCDCAWSKYSVSHVLYDLDQINRVLHEILHTLQHPQLTRSIAICFTGVNMANNSLVFKVGQTSQASIMPLLADGTTPSGGVLSNVQYTFNDPSATVVLNADGLTATVTGVAVSNGPIGGSASCTVTDTDGAVSQWTQAFTIQTDPGQPPDQLTQSVAVQFTDPGAGTGGPAAPKLSAKRPLNE